MSQETQDVAAATALATVPEKEKSPIKIGARGLEMETASEVYRMADSMVKAGVAPKGMSAGGVMAAILKGRALGLDEVTSVTGIVVINGRTQMSGSLLLALLRRAGVEYDIWHEGEGNTRTAFIKAWFPDKPHRAKTRSFSMGDAVRAGLAGKDTYKAWPDDMLLWRAVSKLARQEFPEIGAGIYVYGEIPGDPDPTATPTGEDTERHPIAPPSVPDPLMAELAGQPENTPAEGIHSEASIPPDAPVTLPQEFPIADERAVPPPEVVQASLPLEAPKPSCPHKVTTRIVDKKTRTAHRECHDCGEVFPA